MGEDPQLDLRVVGDQQQLILRPGNEGTADLPAELRSDRDVLQVRVRRAQSPGRRDGLVERGVNPAVSRIHQPRKGLEVGGVQLVELPPRQQRVDDRVPVAELLQHRGVGGQLSLRGSLAGLQPELLVQDLPELGRRVQVELFAREAEHLAPQRRHPIPDRFAHLLEVVHVQPHAPRFHPREHRGQGELDVLQEPAESLSVHLLGHDRGEQGDRRGLCGHGAPGFLGEELPFRLVVGLAQHVGPQLLLAQAAQRVVGRSRIEEVAGQHRVEGHAGDPTARFDRGSLQLLRVVDPLRCFRVGQKSSELAEPRVEPCEGRLRPADRDRRPQHAAALGQETDPEWGPPGHDPGQLRLGDLTQVEIRHVGLRLRSPRDVLQPVEQAPELERGE